jgi:phosphatidylserine/phosphatidylglycerophosphate/cardiolipin synthase-like enzyme
MAIQIEAFANSDDVFVVWRSDKSIDDCIGFELRRTRNGNEEVVKNRITFAGNAVDASKPAPSSESPIRRYAWSDHEPNKGDEVSYRVVPVIQKGNAGPQADTQQQSPPTATVKLTGVVSKSFECYFNRGLVISQFMSRQLHGDLTDANLKKFKNDLDKDGENKVRDFLGGDLRDSLLTLLDSVKADGGEIFLAMFELSDELLVTKLKALGPRAHLVLPNGVHKNREDDENKATRKALNSAGCDVCDRMLPGGVLGHNKFAVVLDKQRKVSAVLTGSTNWTPTGLCTQINNVILMRDEKVAQFFLDQWNRLKDAGDGVPKSLVDANSQVKSAMTAEGDGKVDVWFTRTSHEQEMDAAIKLVKKAKQGIIFLMFQPGGSPILNAIVKMQSDNSPLFVKGVISTAAPDELDPTAHVTLVQRSGIHVQDFRIVQPQGLHAVGNFAAEVMRGKFLHDIGFAIVHSKVIVIDPNGDQPVLVTGSHNFSASASAKNDENLIIIENNKELVKAYAANVQGVFDHYRFRAVANMMQREGKDVVDVMKDPKSWQRNWFQGDGQRELQFWLGDSVTHD